MKVKSKGKRRKEISVKMYRLEIIASDTNPKKGEQVKYTGSALAEFS